MVWSGGRLCSVHVQVLLCPHAALFTCCSLVCSLQWLPLQDNEPLMRALSNLINLNQPDLVLFVGEALVGNDAGGLEH